MKAARRPEPLTVEDLEQIAEGIGEFIIAGNPEVEAIWQPYLDKLAALRADLAATRAIAAAPELLDRVKDAVLVLEALRENWGADHPGLVTTIDEELPPLRAAIANAERRHERL